MTEVKYRAELCHLFDEEDEGRTVSGDEFTVSNAAEYASHCTVEARIFSGGYIASENGIRTAFVTDGVAPGYTSAGYVKISVAAYDSLWGDSSGLGAGVSFRMRLSRSLMPWWFDYFLQASGPGLTALSDTGMYFVQFDGGSYPGFRLVPGVHLDRTVFKVYPANGGVPYGVMPAAFTAGEWVDCSVYVTSYYPPYAPATPYYRLWFIVNGAVTAISTYEVAGTSAARLGTLYLNMNTLSTMSITNVVTSPYLQFADIRRTFWSTGEGTPPQVTLSQEVIGDTAHLTAHIITGADHV